MAGKFLIAANILLFIGCLVLSYHLSQVYFILEDQWYEITIARENIELICMEVDCKYDD
tara:strand:+ start:7252 stop:7428 length:177 start_codon:yes stop_codon:yes gene_type:complete